MPAGGIPGSARAYAVGMSTMARTTQPSVVPVPVSVSSARAEYERIGHHVVRGLLPLAEVESLREHFMRRRAEGAKPGDMGGDPAKGASDPLNRYPRMINMHDWDARTDSWRKDPRLLAAARDLVGAELAQCQTMLYFKPPGARGQALHQDNQYIRKTPLIGCWLALDRCDQANGFMTVVPESHRLGVLPVEEADTSISFTGGGSVLPAGARQVGIDMEPGDVLFFHGMTIHGSYPNRTADRFRRALIVHYLGACAVDLPEDPATSMAGLEARKRGAN